MFTFFILVLSVYCAQGNVLLADQNAVPHGAQIRLSKTGLQYRKYQNLINVFLSQAVDLNFYLGLRLYSFFYLES